MNPEEFYVHVSFRGQRRPEPPRGAYWSKWRHQDQIVQALAFIDGATAKAFVLANLDSSPQRGDAKWARLAVDPNADARHFVSCRLGESRPDAPAGAEWELVSGQDDRVFFALAFTDGATAKAFVLANLDSSLQRGDAKWAGLALQDPSGDARHFVSCRLSGLRPDAPAGAEWELVGGEDGRVSFALAFADGATAKALVLVNPSWSPQRGDTKWVGLTVQDPSGDARYFMFCRFDGPRPAAPAGAVWELVGGEDGRVFFALAFADGATAKALVLANPSWSPQRGDTKWARLAVDPNADARHFVSCRLGESRPAAPAGAVWELVHNQEDLVLVALAFDAEAVAKRFVLRNGCSSPLRGDAKWIVQGLRDPSNDPRFFLVLLSRSLSGQDGFMEEDLPEHGSLELIVNQEHEVLRARAFNTEVDALRHFAANTSNCRRFGRMKPNAHQRKLEGAQRAFESLQNHRSPTVETFLDVHEGVFGAFRLHMKKYRGNIKFTPAEALCAGLRTLLKMAETGLVTDKLRQALSALNESLDRTASLRDLADVLGQLGGQVDEAFPTDIPLSSYGLFGGAYVITKQLSRGDSFLSFKSTFLSLYSSYESVMKRLPEDLITWPSPDTQGAQTAFADAVTYDKKSMGNFAAYWKLLLATKSSIPAPPAADLTPQQQQLASNQAKEWVRDHRPNPPPFAEMKVRLSSGFCVSYFGIPLPDTSKPIEEDPRWHFLRNLHILLYALRNRLIHGREELTIQGNLEEITKRPRQECPIFHDVTYYHFNGTCYEHDLVPGPSDEDFARAGVEALQRTNPFSRLMPTVPNFQEYLAAEPNKVLDHLVDVILPTGEVNKLKDMLEEYEYEILLNLLTLLTAEVTDAIVALTR